MTCAKRKQVAPPPPPAPHKTWLSALCHCTNEQLIVAASQAEYFAGMSEIRALAQADLAALRAAAAQEHA